jgi:hypothetical protein
MEFPRLVKIDQTFPHQNISNMEQEIHTQIQKNEIIDTLKPGMRVAITVGSRGINNVAEIVRILSRNLMELGVKPFIIPAMGSHGGATAEGQKQVLESLGVTEEYCGIPIHSSMDVHEIGKSKNGLPVYMDKYAFEADGVIVMGRIKAHTDFEAEIESGIMKMAAIGMGKHKQAQTIHTYGVSGIRDEMPEAAKVIFSSGKVLFGIGLVEDAYEDTAVIEAIPVNHIFKREKELLRYSKTLMPSIPVENIDILFVDEIGKNYSGTGMDTNIVGRIRIVGVEEPSLPSVKYLIAGDLSEASHGNALGIGLADLTTKRLYDKIDFHAMNENVITSTFLDRAKIPIVLKNDRDAIRAAQRGNWGVSGKDTRFVRIPNTLDIHQLYISENLLPEINESNVKIIEGPSDIVFSSEGNLVEF